MAKAKVLVVDDEPDMLETCRDVLSSDKLKIFTEVESSVAAKRIEKELFDLILVDLKMPKMDGLAFLKHAKKVNSEAVVVMFTGFPTVETAVDAVKEGAYDYITKPFSPDQLRVVVNRAIAQKRLKEENLFLRQEVEQQARFHSLIGKSHKMLATFRLMDQIAQTDSDVLIVGESGTGKELVARGLHAMGKRKEKGFVPLDCGAIPELLLENELFGHEKGAFTGAQSSSLGLLEFAHGGTLFLDEICELPLNLQAKLLRVLQERQVRRVGGKEIINVDVHVIAATNRNIDLEVKEKRFREDLFYRINVVKIEVPPLRERGDDIPLLATHFLELYAKKWEKEIRGIEKEAIEVLRRYSWPGNVRELQNVIKRAVVLCHGDQLNTEDLPGDVFDLGNDDDDSTKSLGFFSFRAKQMKILEFKYFHELLSRHQGDVEKAAEEAQLPRGTLYRLIKKHGLKLETFRS